MVEYYNFQVLQTTDKMFVITESWLDNEISHNESMEEENNIKWNEKILNIPYIDDDIISNNYDNYDEKEYTKLVKRDRKYSLKQLPSISPINFITIPNNEIKYNITYDKMNHIKEHFNKYNIFNRNYKKFTKNIDKKKKNTSIDYIKIYIISIYNNNQHPLHYSLKRIIEKYKNEHEENPNELLYKDMINLFKNESTTCQMNKYIESIIKNKKHPLNKSLCNVKYTNNKILEKSLNSQDFVISKLSINSIDSMTGGDYFENSIVNSLSNSYNTNSLVSFAQSILTTFIEVDDNDIILGSEIAKEDDIDKDNWNNFHWNGQERPSLKELGIDDVPKSFWNSEVWNNNDYNQSEIIGKNSEILEYCGTKSDDEDINIVVTEDVSIQDAYPLITENDIVKILIDELESCYYEIS
ncbi:Hypothetical protein SRAE_1000078400 [Strongyloides ratti]|uniref:Uncharacterized protein n=1 Tax=Strongyloides ratti TaxID=34506 RepID=A0A090L4T2_STRRB|nr:Hypothetical protein SRAE_1000078400 [Strongyloides ratti]CEF62514.1 Hypothetical protein SRAE_1000078400 [Strongyloides ratti]